MNEVAQCINVAAGVYSLIKQNPMLASFEEFKGLTDFFESCL